MLAAKIAEELRRYGQDLGETREEVINFIDDISIPRQARLEELAKISRIRVGLCVNASMIFHGNLMNECYERIFDETNTPEENISSFQWFFQNDERLDAKPELERRFVTYLENRLPNFRAQEYLNVFDVFKTERPGLIALKRQIQVAVQALDIGKRKVYYDDAQSVHDPGVQLSFRESAAKFDSAASDNFDLVIQEIESVVCSSPEALSSLERIKIDVSELNIANLLCNVWRKIKASEFRSELTKRLTEELEDMNGKCSSGIATRIVNVLSGFDGEIGIKINVSTELFAIWNMRLQDVLVKDESLMDAFVNGTYSFYLWLKDFKEKFFEEMKKDYDGLVSAEILKELVEKL